MPSSTMTKAATMAAILLAGSIEAFSPSTGAARMELRRQQVVLSAMGKDPKNERSKKQRSKNAPLNAYVDMNDPIAFGEASKGDATKTVGSLESAYQLPTVEHPPVRDERVAKVNGGAVAVAADPPMEFNAKDFSMLHTPAEAFQILAEKGEANGNASTLKTVISAVYGGMCVGMGGMLSLAIAGNMGGVAITNPGLAKFVFAALFPVNLFVCLLTGGQLFTGNTANMMAAYFEKKVTMKQVVRNWLLSFSSNFVGCATFAGLCKYCGVLAGGAATMASGLVGAKTSMAFGPIFVKALLCNWLVCLAVYLSMQSKDMAGKYVGIFLPISAFVSIGFEHSVANMFLLPAGLLGSATGISFKTALIKNMLPVTLGNAVGGAVMVAAMLSFMFGRLGENH
eukprot:CAMPEP_0198115266 /NCGR_PEP_ID=MMETSP1442-20131203/6422_1 /TAXON_ID= /ORGANISM="Craspedostauros australis, Strain CCMP3328" /LENGTH=396 /DNA_ID=CAMNT_0043772753 /DNA_START=96 /DNA_END=1286 /DNA_ORIENTATION=+